MSKQIEISDRGLEFMQMVEQMDSIDMEFLRRMFPEIDAADFASFLQDSHIVADETANTILQQLIKTETKEKHAVDKQPLHNAEPDKIVISDYLAHSLTEIYWSEVEVSRAFASLSELAYNKGLQTLLYNYGVAASNRMLMIEDSFGWVTKRPKSSSRMIIQWLVASGREDVLLLSGNAQLSTLRLVEVAKLITDYQEMLYRAVVLLNLPDDQLDTFRFARAASVWFDEYERQLSLVNKRYHNFNELRQDQMDD